MYSCIMYSILVFFYTISKQKNHKLFEEKVPNYVKYILFVTPKSRRKSVKSFVQLVIVWRMVFWITRIGLKWKIYIQQDFWTFGSPIGADWTFESNVVDSLLVCVLQSHFRQFPIVTPFVQGVSTTTVGCTYSVHCALQVS